MNQIISPGMLSVLLKTRNLGKRSKELVIERTSDQLLIECKAVKIKISNYCVIGKAMSSLVINQNILLYNKTIANAIISTFSRKEDVFSIVIGTTNSHKDQILYNHTHSSDMSYTKGIIHYVIKELFNCGYILSVSITEIYPTLENISNNCLNSKLNNGKNHINDINIKLYDLANNTFIKFSDDLAFDKCTKCSNMEEYNNFISKVFNMASLTHELDKNIELENYSLIEHKPKAHYLYKFIISFPNKEKWTISWTILDCLEISLNNSRTLPSQFALKSLYDLQMVCDSQNHSTNNQFSNLIRVLLKQAWPTLTLCIDNTEDNSHDIIENIILLGNKFESKYSGVRVNENTLRDFNKNTMNHINGKFSKVSSSISNAVSSDSDKMYQECNSKAILNELDSIIKDTETSLETNKWVSKFMQRKSKYLELLNTRDEVKSMPVSHKMDLSSIASNSINQLRSQYNISPVNTPKCMHKDESSSNLEHINNKEVIENIIINKLTNIGTKNDSNLIINKLPECNHSLTKSNTCSDSSSNIESNSSNLENQLILAYQEILKLKESLNLERNQNQYKEATDNTLQHNTPLNSLSPEYSVLVKENTDLKNQVYQCNIELKEINLKYSQQLKLIESLKQIIRNLTSQNSILENEISSERKDIKIHKYFKHEL